MLHQLNNSNSDFFAFVFVVILIAIGEACIMLDYLVMVEYWWVCALFFVSCIIVIQCGKNDNHSSFPLQIQLLCCILVVSSDLILILYQSQSQGLFSLNGNNITTMTFLPTVFFHTLFCIVAFMALRNKIYLSIGCFLLFCKVAVFVTMCYCVAGTVYFITTQNVGDGYVFLAAIIATLFFVTVIVLWYQIVQMGKLTSGSSYKKMQLYAPIPKANDISNVDNNNNNNNYNYNYNHNERHPKKTDDIISKVKETATNKCGMNVQTLIVVLNAIVSTIGTMIILIYEIGQPKSTTIRSNSSSSSNNGVIYKIVTNHCTTTTHKFKTTRGLEPECVINAAAIGVGILILFIIGIGHCCCKQKKKCIWSCCNFLKCICFRGFQRELMDTDIRCVIILKFCYFLIKPELIAITANSANKNNSLFDIFGLVYKILMFCTTTALAYITFNRKYQLIQKLDNIMNNAKAFGQTYIASYLTSIVATYTIFIFILVITWNDNKDMKQFRWYLVIYPQCVWLMFVKLYHNEICHLVAQFQTRSLIPNYFLASECMDNFLHKQCSNGVFTLYKSHPKSIHQMIPLVRYTKQNTHQFLDLLLGKNCLGMRSNTSVSTIMGFCGMKTITNRILPHIYGFQFGLMILFVFDRLIE